MNYMSYIISVDYITNAEYTNHPCAYTSITASTGAVAGIGVFCVSDAGYVCAGRSRRKDRRMPDKQTSKRTEKVQVMLGDDELEAIDQWRFGNRLPSRAAAIRELIRRGLVTADNFETPPTAASSGEFRVTEPPKAAG